MMWWNKFTMRAIVGLTTALGIGLGWASFGLVAQVPSSAGATAGATGQLGAGRPEADQNARLAQVVKQRHESAVREWSERWKEYQAGRGSLDVLLENGHRVLESELEMSDKPADRLDALSRYQALMDGVLKENEERAKVGRLPIQDVETSRYHSLSAEIMLLRAKKEAGAEPKPPGREPQR